MVISKQEITCKCGCGRKRLVRTADIKRGWGKFFDKSCKAHFQEKNTGQFRAYIRGEGVSHAAKRRGEDPQKAVLKYAEDNGLIDHSDWLHPEGYGHILASGDAGHGQE